MRPSQRKNNELRTIKINRHFTKYAEGAVLIEFGATQVLCTASIIPGVPIFLKDTKTGWITAEYGMLPRSTQQRMQREAAKGKQSGRTQEIQRLIGRALRCCVDLKQLGENTIIIDCDVLQADGGTRTAAITGGCVALYDALKIFTSNNKLPDNPFRQFVAGVSVGIYQQQLILDLDYAEDSNAETDMNVVMTDKLSFIELQGTAEKATFDRDAMNGLLDLATAGVQQLIRKQQEVVG